MSRMDPQDARQGRTGTPVLRILIAALALCVVGGIGMALYGWAMPDQTLPKAEQGSGLGAPSSDNAPASQGNTTVTPEANGPSGSGNAPN
jgi:hypothetical protein